MQDDLKQKLIQESVDYRTKMAQRTVKIGIAWSYLIGAITSLSLLLSQDELAKTTSDKMQTAAAALFMVWAYMNAQHKKLNTENKLMYTALQDNEETQLEFPQEMMITKNIAVGSIVGLSSCLATSIPIIAAGTGHLSSGEAACASAGLLIAGIKYLSDCSKRNNHILKNEMPAGVILPNLYKTRMKE